MKIIIDFDPVAQEVLSVTVGDSVKTPAVRKSKSVIDSAALNAVLESNKLIITPALATLLKVKEGDRLIIRYKEDGEFIEPFLAPPSVFNEEGGNKLTKGLSISFRGDQHSALSRFGNQFEIQDMGDGSIKLLSVTKVRDVVPSITLEALAPSVAIGDDLVLNKNSFVIE